jgi:hypothetical protein
LTATATAAAAAAGRLARAGSSRCRRLFSLLAHGDGRGLLLLLLLLRLVRWAAMSRAGEAQWSV